MSNTKKIASAAFTGAAAAAMTLMGGGAAFATSGPHAWNGSKPYSGPIKAKPKAGTSVSFVDKTTNKALKCPKAVVSGVVKSHGSPIGHLKKSTTKWSSCKVSGQAFKAHLTTSPNLILKKFNFAASSWSSAKLSGRTSVKISATGIFACKATISGTSIPFKYKNHGNLFSVNPGRAATLKVKSATNCLGLITAGDTADFTGTYVFSTPPDLRFTP